MKKTFARLISSVLSVSILCSISAIGANAETIFKYDADGNVTHTFIRSLTVEEVDKYNIRANPLCVVPNQKLDPDDPFYEGSIRALFADPSASFCVEANIYPNKYGIIPPDYIAKDPITENNGYYKYLSDRGYESGTFEIEPGVFPCEAGLYYGLMKLTGNELSYLTLPLSADDIPKAEAFIEANDREGLYDFIAEKHQTTHPYFGEQNDFTSIVNRDYTPAYSGMVWCGKFLDECTPDQIYQMVIDQYVYPYFGAQKNPTSGSSETPDVNLIIGDTDMDGRVSIVDIVLTNKMCLGVIAPKDTIQRYCADVDGNHVIDSNDLLLMMQFAVQIIDEFPAYK